MQPIGEIESRLERLELRMDTFSVELRAEIRSSEEETRRQLRRDILDGDAQTGTLIEQLRREMHEGDAQTRALIDEIRREMHIGDAQTRALIDALRVEMHGADEETRRLMRVLHEDVIERIRTLGEQLATPPSSPGPSRPSRRRRPQ
jgi:hypothetical protein